MTIDFSARNLFDNRNILPSLWNGENGIPDEGRQWLIAIRGQF
ncbi:MAG: hypothetical protein V2I33_09120 [Kangiellaceae bacterium]|nr:hypothetical protein [Kangiellaceae bacterium]